MDAIRGAVLPRIPVNPYAMPGRFHFDPDPAAQGNPPANPPAPLANDPKPAKVELTEEELNQRIAKAVEAEKKKADAAREEERKKAEAEAARKTGEFEKLYNAEVEQRKADQQKAAEAELRARRAEVHNRLSAYLSEKHPDYIAAAKYMQPLLTIAADTDDADADKQIKAVAEEYVKDNPRQKASGTTLGAVRGKSDANGTIAVPDKLPARRPFETLRARA